MGDVGVEEGAGVSEAGYPGGWWRGEKRGDGGMKGLEAGRQSVAEVAKGEVIGKGEWERKCVRVGGWSGEDDDQILKLDRGPREVESAC